MKKDGWLLEGGPSIFRTDVARGAFSYEEAAYLADAPVKHIDARHRQAAATRERERDPWTATSRIVSSQASAGPQAPSNPTIAQSKDVPGVVPCRALSAA